MDLPLGSKTLRVNHFVFMFVLGGFFPGKLGDTFLFLLQSATFEAVHTLKVKQSQVDLKISTNNQNLV